LSANLKVTAAPISVLQFVNADPGSSSLGVFGTKPTENPKTFAILSMTPHRNEQAAQDP
jgi:hypothetical protein